MTNPRITLLQSHETQLIDYLEGHAEGHERAAVILFRKVSRNVPGFEPSDRYLSYEVHLFKEEWIISSSPTHIDFHKQPLRELYRRCKDEGLEFGFVHNHPSGMNSFSSKDDENEESLLQGIVNRNGTASDLVALLLVKNRWLGRVRSGSSIGVTINSRHISVVGDSLKVHIADSSEKDHEFLKRQMAAFGKPFVSKLRSLRIAIVGAGGTGSPSATLLARSGASELIIIDNDDLEDTNINRVRGSRFNDIGKNKAEIQKSFIEEVGLPCKVVPIKALVHESAEAVAALSTADVIFGCTDDWAGRSILNRSAYFYLQPLIDMGLGGEIGEGETGAEIKRHSGRISTVLPDGGICLFCQGAVKEEWVAHQLEMQRDPIQAEENVRNGYLQGGGEQAPGVGPFTGCVADLALATFFDLLKPYRHLPPELVREQIFIDFVNMRLKSKQISSDPECPFCGESQEFLAAKENSYLLGRPALRIKK